MDKQQALGLFALAHIPVIKIWERPNQYWPDTYVEARKQHPWWLVQTSRGMVELGWRKRVISIDWADTDVRQVLTEDEVTKDQTMVHAYSYAKAVEYLSVLSKAMAYPSVDVTREMQEAYDNYVRGTWDKQGDWEQWMACVAWMHSINEKDQSRA
jgi:hypothetical protein